MDGKQPAKLPPDFDFIKAFIEISGHISDVSDDFSEAIALFTLSSAAGRAFGIESKHKFSLKENEFNDVGHMFLNTWYDLIGPSRTGRKGTVKGFGLDLIEVHKPEIELSNSFTPEALIGDMSDKYDGGTKSCVGALIIDESRMWFESLDRDYMKGATPLLSLMYDGRSFTRRTQGGGRRKVTDPYLTMLLLGTPDVVDFFRKRYFNQGWANRLFYVLGKRKQGWKTAITPRTKELRAQLNAYIKILFKNKNPFTLITLPAKLAGINEKTEEMTDVRLDNERLGMMTNWVGNRPELILKVAGLKRLSHLSEEERGKLENGMLMFLPLTIEDYEYAVAWADKCEAWLKKIVEAIPEVSRASKEQRTDSEFVFEVIRRAGKDGISSDALTRAVNKQGIKGDRRRGILTDLIEAGQVRTVRGEPTGGNKETRWFAA